MVAVVLIAVYLVREPLLGGVVARIAGDRLSASLGGTVTIAQVGGSWFGGVVVDGVAGEGLAGGAVARLDCDRLVIDWRLFDLLRGRGLGSVARVQAEGLAITIAPAAAAPSAAKTSTFDLATLPEALPALDVDARITVRTLHGDIRLDAVRLRFDGRAGQLAVAGANLPVIGALDAFALSFARSGDRLNLDGVEAIAGVVPRRIEVVLGRAGPEVTAELGVLGGILTLTGNRSAAGADATGLDLSAAPPWLARLMAAAAPDSGRIDLSLRATNRDGWTLAGRVEATAVAWIGFTVDRAVVTGRLDGAEVRIDQAAIDGYGLAVAASRLAWAQGSRWPTDGRIELAAADLRPLLTAFLPRVPRPPGQVALRAALLAADGAVRTDGVAVSSDGWRVEADATLAADGEATVDGHVTVDALAALGWLIPLDRDSAGRGQVRCAYRGAFRRRSDGLPVGRATLALSGDDLVLARRRLGRVTLDAALADGRTTLEFASRGAHGAFTLAAAGWREAGDLALRVERASGEWRTIPWSLDAPADLRFGADRLRLHPTTMRVGDGTLAIDVDLGQRWRAAATLDHFPIATGSALLGLDATSGTLTGSLTVDGPADRPLATVTLDLTAGTVAGLPARLRFAGEQDDSGLRLTACDLGWGDLVSLEATGTWPLAFGRSGAVATGGVPDLRATLAVPELARLLPSARLSGALLATISADVVAGEPRGRLVATGRGLRVRSADPESSPAPALDAALEASADASGATLGLRLRDGEAEVLIANLVSPAALTPRDLLAPAAWRPRPVRGSIDLDGLPLTPVQPLAPALLGLAGRIAGMLAISGTVGDPRASGTLTLADAEFKLRSDLPRFTAGAGMLTLADRVLTIAVTGELGYAPIACRGTAALDGRGVPVLGLRLTGTNALLAQDRDLRLRATLDVGLAGPFDALSASGRVDITDALWSKRIDLIRSSTPDADERLQFFAIRGGPFAAMRLDLRIAADRSLRLVNNLINADCSLDLVLRGTGAVPVPEGRLWTTAARLSLPFSSLTIDRAEVRFTPENPFRPNLEASARTRMQGFELVASAKGPIDEVEVTVTASPPLPAEDAVLLLTTGSTRVGLAEAGQRGALTRVGTYLGQELLRKASGPGNPDKESLIDKVALSIGERTSKSGLETLAAEVVVVPERRPPPRPRQGLRIGELVLVGERDYYDAFNIGLVFRLRFR